MNVSSRSLSPRQLLANSYSGSQRVQRDATDTRTTSALDAEQQRMNQLRAFSKEAAVNPTKLETVFDLRNSTLVEMNDQAMQLAQARVVIADYGRLRADFPGLREKSDPEIDAWLENHAGNISRQQVEQGVNNGTNTEIPITGKEVRSYRALGAGRALAYETNEMSPDNEPYLLDVKGAGAKDPQLKSHGNGLATLNEGLREYHYEKLLGAFLAHSQKDGPFENAIDGKTIETVPVYAVLSAGFDAIVEDHDPTQLERLDSHSPAKTHLEPAGLIVRRCEARKGPFTNEAGLPNLDLPAMLDLNVEMELAMRRYGITSAVVDKKWRQSR